MHLPRFRVRTMLIGVAVVALAIAAEETTTRHVMLCRAWAAIHAMKEEACRVDEAHADDPARRQKFGSLAEREALLRKKYERGALRPWEILHPDPPPIGE